MLQSPRSCSPRSRPDAVAGTPPALRLACIYRINASAAPSFQSRSRQECCGQFGKSGAMSDESDESGAMSDESGHSSAVSNAPVASTSQ